MDRDKVLVTGSIDHNLGRCTNSKTTSPNLELTAIFAIKLVLPSSGQCGHKPVQPLSNIVGQTDRLIGLPHEDHVSHGDRPSISKSVPEGSEPPRRRDVFPGPSWPDILCLG